MNNNRIAVIFGAGATRGAFQTDCLPPPIDKDFFDIAGQIRGRGTPRLAKRVIGDVFDLYGCVSGISLEQYFRDIETRAEVSNFAKTKNKPKDWATRQINLEELIRRVLLQTTCDFTKTPAACKKSSMHTNVLNRLVPKDTVITFNYDTLIEESFPNGSSWNPKFGYGITAHGADGGWAKRWKEAHNCGSAQSNPVGLLKLHGSLNWTLYKTREVRLKPRPYVVRTNNGSTVRDKCAIVPPGWLKRVNVSPYRQLWQNARLKLEQCATLAVIGYSLPETDRLAKAFFAEIVRMRAERKEFLRHLYIADPNEAIKDRFANLFAPALGPKGHVYRYGGIQEFADSWQRTAPAR